uniref:7TM_GPCR_Srx domain-containing protein n=1 Tax=Elaeophora elaphi TaxID=1147741 RepID=A0A0R3S269_9BILA
MGPYNATFSVQQLAKNIDATYCIDNGILHIIALHTLRANHGDFNYLISMTIFGITSFLRFPGKMDSDLRKLVGSMVTSPRLHSLTSSFVSRLLAIAFIIILALERAIICELLSPTKLSFPQCKRTISVRVNELPPVILLWTLFGCSSHILGAISHADKRQQPPFTPTPNISKPCFSEFARAATVSTAFFVNTTVIRKAFARVGTFHSHVSVQSLPTLLHVRKLENTESQMAGNYEGLILEYASHEKIELDQE